MVQFLLATLVSLSAVSAFAGYSTDYPPPADITVKCTLTDAKSTQEEILNFEFGRGQKLLVMSGAEKIIVELSSNNSLEAGFHDLKVYVKDAIIAAKSITVSDDQTHGVHVLRTSKKLSSIFCGI